MLTRALVHRCRPTQLLPALQGGVPSTRTCLDPPTHLSPTTPLTYPQQQRRGAKKARVSPIVKRKRGDYEYDDVTPEDARATRMWNEAVQREEAAAIARNAAALEAHLQDAARKNDINITADAALAFIADFVNLMRQNSKTDDIAVRDTTNTIGPFMRLLERYNLEPTTHPLQNIAFILLLRTGRMAKNMRDTGTAMLYHASEAGNVAATIRIMNHVYIRIKDEPNLSSILQVQLAAKRLSEIAAGPERTADTWVAMVLEGKFQYDRGNIERAVSLWKRALPTAKLRAMSGEGGMAANYYYLSAPWNDLAKACQSRNFEHFPEARAAIAFGCSLDDPTSHYYAADYLLQKVDHAPVYTNSWLYHMTKAAASGHVVAMHRLGIYYSETTWPYIENGEDIYDEEGKDRDSEPPDHVKPTPFDRYPPDALTLSPAKRLMAATGFAELVQHPASRPIHDVFHTAVFPSTTEGRLRMAIEWFELAMEQMYAPSFYQAALLHLKKREYDRSAPPEAVQVNHQRYSFKSRKAFEEQGRRASHEDPPAVMVDNPIYDPDRAKELVTEIFYAREAIRARLVYFRDRKRREHDPHSKNWIDYIYTYPHHVYKWYSYIDIAKDFMDDKGGKLWDKEMATSEDLKKGRDLIFRAESICDKHKWDIYNTAGDGGLLYRYKR